MAADWIVAPPSRTPKFWGYSTGVYSHVEIKQNQQTLAETAEANRRQYIEQPAPQNYGALDDREQVKNVLTNLDAAQNAMAYSRAELTPSWTYLEPGEEHVNPRWQLDWLLENKLSAPPANPPIVVNSRSAVTGEILHQIRSAIAEDDVDYAIRMKVKFKANFEQAAGATVDPTLGGRMLMVCQNSRAEAFYDPTVGADGQWTLVRKTLQSTGQYYERTYTWPGHSFEKVFSFYPTVTGNRPMFFALQVNHIGNPKIEDEGKWESVHPENKTTFMNSSAGHATGLDAVRDDKWSGQIWIEPQATIRH